LCCVRTAAAAPRSSGAPRRHREPARCCRAASSAASVPPQGRGMGDAAGAPPPRVSPLAPAHKYAYAAGHCLNDLTASAWFGLVLLVFTQVDQLSKHDAGLLMLIGQARAATCTRRRPSFVSSGCKLPHAGG
jgi:hypothetical protein